MKFSRRLVVAALVGLGSLAIAIPVGEAQTPPAPTEPPNGNLVWPDGGTKRAVFLYVDTVTAPGGKINPLKSCVRSSQFRRGEKITFRVSAFDAKTLKPLTDKQVKYMYVKIPGLPNQGPFTYGKHGADINTAPWFWTLGWVIPDDYPLGTMDFQVVVKSKTGAFGYFKQIPVPTSLLTVLP